MTPFEQNLSEISRIYFIAEDATGPFRKVIQIVLKNGQIHSFDKEQDCREVIRWLYDQNLNAAINLEVLFAEKDENNVEVLIYRNDQA